MFNLVSPGRVFLACECGFLFLVLPLLVALHPTHVVAATVLWTFTFYAGFILHKQPGFIWRTEWRGLKLSPRDIEIIAARFVASSLCIFALTEVFLPAGLWAFPLRRTGLWLAVMLLYPLVSALPQELVYRSFFFRRYRPLFPDKYMPVASAVAFGLLHIVFRHPFAPFLSLICGFFLASSYKKHASLGQATLEHALYGDMVFTVGLGVYFVLAPVFR